jgi:hypothetical protein
MQRMNAAHDEMPPNCNCCSSILPPFCSPLPGARYIFSTAWILHLGSAATRRKMLHWIPLASPAPSLRCILQQYVQRAFYSVVFHPGFLSLVACFKFETAVPGRFVRGSQLRSDLQLPSPKWNPPFLWGHAFSACPLLACGTPPSRIRVRHAGQLRR